MKKKKPSKELKAMHNEAKKHVVNGLTEAIMGFQPGGIGEQLTSVETLFKNNRWYLISNMRQALSEIYVEHGIVKTIVDVPVDDGMRGGVDIKSKQLDPEDIEKLYSVMEREGDLIVMAQAMKWTRLFGGGGIVMITDQDPEKEFKIEAVTEDSPLTFRAVDMWELFWSHQNTSDYEAVIDGDQLSQVEFYSYYSKKLHHSHVLSVKGFEAPSFVRPRLRGWGLSVVEVLVRSINQYIKANNLIFEVLDEFKIDVYKIKDLASTLMSPNGTKTVTDRIALANQQKNFQNAITMDAEDDFLQKELSFAGISETLTGIRMQIASDLRMPLTKVFGISSTGFSSGQDDIENYNAMIESQIRSKSKYDILKIIEIRCQKLFGFMPDDITIDFKPLRVLSAEQEEGVKTQQFARLIQAKQAGLIGIKDFLDACNAKDLLGIQVDTDEASLPDEKEIAEIAMSQKDGAAAGGAPKSALAPKEAGELKNSLEYDVAAYEADGGESQFDPWMERRVLNPGKVDEALWKKSKDASMAAFKKIKWQFVTWFYKQHGGKFE